jgi:hypothetical protein
MLKVRFREGRLVRRQWMMGCTAGGKEKKGDERRQQDQRKVTSLSVGQGEPPAGVINSYSQLGKGFFGFPFSDRIKTTCERRFSHSCFVIPSAFDIRASSFYLSLTYGR